MFKSLSWIRNSRTNSWNEGKIIGFIWGLMSLICRHINKTQMIKIWVWSKCVSKSGDLCLTPQCSLDLLIWEKIRIIFLITYFERPHKVLSNNISWQYIFVTSVKTQNQVETLWREFDNRYKWLNIISHLYSLLWLVNDYAGHVASCKYLSFFFFFF